MEIGGRSLLGGGVAGGAGGAAPPAGGGGAGGPAFHAVHPATGETLPPACHPAAAADVDRAASLAAEAAPAMARLPGAERARFLREVAARLDAATGDLVPRARAETALPEARLAGEIGRTTGQLRLFAGLVERGDWVGARIETADPARRPAPKPDHRSMARAIGPVVVFGSSNFPFAFSVAGGDTASAFAAGNPVIVKAHPAHPGTSELVGRTVDAAARACGLPPGAFALLYDSGFLVGQALVAHPAVRAVGFTGSRRGGRALMDLASRRPEPIPVHAEMGSINPVFLLPGALAERGEAIASALAASITLGVGQFCTCPGLLVLRDDGAGRRFVGALAARLEETPPQPMLTAAIHAAYVEGAGRRAAMPGVRLATGSTRVSAGGGAPALFTCDAEVYLGEPALSEELFGPSAVAVLCPDGARLFDVARGMEGSLTASVHASGSDAPEAAALLEVLASRAGRVLVNGVPTGVEVSHAMVHGGPYPATSDGRSTSVGTQAIQRFTRLVCYQDVPDAWLPAALRDANPLGILRLVNGEWTRGPVAR